MAEHTGANGVRGWPRDSHDVLKLLACDVRREVLYQLIEPVEEVAELAARVDRELPHVSKAVSRLLHAGLIDVRHVKQFHACSLSDRVVVRHDGDMVFIEITALNGDRVRVGIRMVAADTENGLDGSSPHVP